MRIRLLLGGAAALLLYPFVAWSQVDEDTGDRENYVLVPSGQVLVVSQPNDDQASLVRRAPDGTESTIVSYQQALSGGNVDGVGSNPHMNAGGVAAFQLCLDRTSDCDSSEIDTGMYTGTPGSVTTIATTGDTVAGETICHVEPFPLINAANQVFWGTTVEGGAGQDTCDEDGDDSTNGRKAIYRFTPPSTNTLLLVSDINSANGPDSVMAVAPFGTDTYTITDAHLIAFGGDAVTSSGNALVTAWLDDNPAAGIDKERRALLYLTSTTISLVAMDDRDGAAPGDSSPIGEMGKGVANANGLVFFKAQTTTGADAPASMNLWTTGGGMSELVATGDGLPLGPGTFDGFAPHQDLNSVGAAAFTAGLDINSSCDGADPFSGFGSGNSNLCRGVYYSPNGSSLVEVARNTTAATAGGTGVSSSADGFEFLLLGSVAVMAENGTVFFVAENKVPDTECGLPNSGDELAFGGNGRDNGNQTPDNTRNDKTAVIAWRPGSEPVKVIAEGDVLPQGKVTRLFTPMPELRQHDDGNDNFVIRAWFDTTGNCTSDSEEIILASAVFPGAIPALGPWGLWLLVGFLAMLGGGRLLRRRT